jgi:hypothetical protein
MMTYADKLDVSIANRKEAHTMKLRPYFLVLLSIAATTDASTPQNLIVFQTGNTILEKCKGSTPYDEALCAIYVAGVADTIRFFAALPNSDSSPEGPKTLCVPKTVTQGQVGKVFAKYLNDHPQDLHFPATVLAFKSLVEAFPCPQGE